MPGLNPSALSLWRRTHAPGQSGHRGVRGLSRGPRASALPRSPLFEVIARFVFNTSTGTGGELTNYPIIWAAMVGAAVAARSGVHIGVDIVVKQMSPQLAKATVLLSLLVSAVFTLIIAWLGHRAGAVLLRYPASDDGAALAPLDLFLSVPVGMS